MHLHAWYIERFVQEQTNILSNCRLTEVFSLSKNELFIQWLTPKNLLINWRLQWEANNCFLSFPEELNVQSRKRLKQFQSTHGLLVKNVTKHPQERSFHVELENGTSLVFKLHGPNANLLCIPLDGEREMFRQGQKSDTELEIDSLLHHQLWTLDELSKFSWFKKLASKLELKSVENLKQTYLEEPIFLIQEDSSYNLVPFAEEALGSYDTVSEAWNDFAKLYLKYYHFHKEKKSLLEQKLRDLKHKTKLYEGLVKRVKLLENGSSYRHWGDLIFSNLTKIHEGDTSVEVEDYLSGKTIKIPLKKDLIPQENAERYYKKAKNENIELQFAQSNKELSEAQVFQLEEEIETIEATSTWKELKPLIKTKVSSQHKESRKEYHHFDFKGFTILVGKSSRDNDLLSFQVAKKDDLWLHARDVAGSHVVIKYRSGQGFPNDVIEYAASLAAWFSKRKTETLCPVIYTPKKFIRKRKGAMPGEVVVDKESVIIVEPKAPN